jgi:serine phosphatase RsbU (regulator of sigma subunit)/sensor domain CHASE-containing protein
MNLRQKTLFIVNITLISLITFLQVAASIILSKSIGNAEDNEARQTIKGVENLVLQTQQSFRERFLDWSAWDDTYNFINNLSPSYIQSNLVPNTLANLKVNLMLFIDNSGKIVYGTGFDIGSKKYQPIPGEISTRLTPDNLLLKHSDLTSNYTGIINLASGAMLITSQPIITSNNSGPIRGTIIVGRYLDNIAINQLSKSARLPLSLYQINDNKLTPKVKNNYEKLLERKTTTLVEAIDENSISGYSLIKDVYGQPALLLQVDMPRTSYQKSKSSFYYMMATLIAAGIVFDILILFLLERSILHRLSLLIDGVSTVREKKNLSLRLPLSGKDEISQLIGNINQMLETLEVSDTNQKKALTDLAKANQEIKSLNRSLKSENNRMGSELAVTRSLQQIILPKDNEIKQIPELDIATLMEAASEVGGDYYDVISYKGGIKIGIGDVTGHGLESGMLMLMIQTSVKTLVESNIIEPDESFNILNRVIYDNLSRMNSDKNLTLSLLDYQDGYLRFSGQHEEIILVRANGYIERIETIDLGFPIGLEEDISSYINYSEVQLHPGDGVVLYTDGLTEAENLLGKQYGVERLCQVVSAYWQYSADEIKQAVINDLNEYIGEQIILDDITLLVVKKR